MSTEQNVQSIPISQIRPGKIRHKSLTAQQEDLARQLYDICGHLVQPTFEQWSLRSSETAIRPRNCCSGTSSPERLCPAT